MNETVFATSWVYATSWATRTAHPFQATSRVGNSLQTVLGQVVQLLALDSIFLLSLLHRTSKEGRVKEA
jgi:hypothetical protein